MANPLHDELSDEAKAWLSERFAELKRHFQSSPNLPAGMAVRLIQQRNTWDRL